MFNIHQLLGSTNVLSREIQSTASLEIIRPVGPSVMVGRLLVGRGSGKFGVSRPLFAGRFTQWRNMAGEGGGGAGGGGGGW